MPVRHHVSNLAQRGNVYYWRPRMPAGTISCGRKKHLSLSLRITDHARAKSVAMRLNARLEDIRARMMMMEAWSANQLQMLFQDEIARASNELETLAVAGRRVGSSSQDQLVADQDVGWAYRLISVFGARRALEFVGDCPGLRYLERFGVPSDRIPFVVQTFRQEQHYCRSTGYDDHIQGRLRDRGLESSPLMRERAATKIAKARSDVMLGSRSLYPDLVVFDHLDASSHSDSVELFEVPSNPSEPKEQKDRDIPVDGLLVLCRRYLEGRDKEIEKRTRRDIEVVVSTFVDILQARLCPIMRHSKEPVPFE